MASPVRFDVVVVGAGSAGAAVAARLSEDPSRRVLLVEAGPDYRPEDTRSAVRGGNFFRALAISQLRWPDVSVQLTDAQRPRSYVCGRGVGGSSVINGQSAVRGLPGDFDRWAASGCPSWSWAEVGPAYRTIEDDLDFGTEPHHGRGGPVPVSRVPESAWGASSRALADAATGIGHGSHVDINAPGSTGVSAMAWNRRSGARVSMKDAYIEPSRPRGNLRVMANASALRVRFRRCRFTGFELLTPAGIRTVEAGHGVVCAGAVHSPALLLRSGIGPARDLRALGIPVVQHLPGVGGNLQDHPTVWIRLTVAASARPADRDALPGHCASRFASGLPGSSSADLQLFVSDHAGTASGGALMVALMDPSSTGRLALVSPDPTVEPQILFRMLTDRGDVARLGVGLRAAARVLEHPAFAPVLDGPARWPAGLRGGGFDDHDLPQRLRSSCGAYNHATGTCRMGPPSAPDTVVDERGSVLGVEGLSVVDASVMPRIVRAPTNLTVVMIAERMAPLLDAH